MKWVIYPHTMNKFPTYTFLSELFLRAPYYSFGGYDPDRLEEVLKDHGFRNGLFLASPAFYRVLKEKGFELCRLSEKEKHSAGKYYNRMCFRPTPFGSFASFTLLSWAGGETVKLAGEEGTVLHLFPDAKLAASQPRVPIAKGDIELIKNPTLYALGSEMRFVKSVIDPRGHYRFTLESIDADDFYHSLFRLFAKAQNRSDLVSWIGQYAECDLAEANDFCEFLLNEQILYSPLTGHIIGDPLEGEKCDPCRKTWSKYQGVSVKITASLEAIAGQAALTLKNTGIGEHTNYFYAGLERSVYGGGPGEQDQAEIALAVALLRRLASPSSSAALTKFIADFQGRFDREKVPLLAALDPDAGISYGNFGISGPARGFEDINIREAQEKAEPVAWTKLHSWLFGLLSAAREHGRFSPLVLTEAHFSEIEQLMESGLAPSTIAVMFRKTADHLLIEYAGGAAAAGLVGRFSVFSSEAAALCEKLAGLEAQSDPEILFADIGQLSDEHTDNINRRLKIYPYEIPLNVYSILGDAAQLKPEDLTLCVREGQLILESSSLRKRVIPRLASAYNFKHNELAIFRLLGDLQYQGLQANLNFNPEFFFPGMRFYPRVQISRTIISPARWHFDSAELGQLENGPVADSLSHLRDFRQRFSLPQKVSIGQFDQQLVFDLSNVQEALFFLKCIKGVTELTITEYLLPDRSVKCGYEPFAGQFIAFLHHSEKIYDERFVSDVTASDETVRSFLPGSSWLYIKIFCTPASADRIIAKVVRPVISRNLGEIRKWFFIRYVENGYHLRLRLQVPEEQVGRMLVELKDQLVMTGHESLVKNYQADIYKREMERYAGVIEEVEAFFHAGSELVAHYLELTEEHEVLSAFFLGLYTAYQMVLCFQDELAALKEFTGQMAADFISKFGGNKELKRDMDLKYRSMRGEVEALLEGPVPVQALAVEFSALIGRVTGIVNKIAEQKSDRWAVLLADLVHMQMNRTFSVKQRTHEFMVYYFLNKYAVSRLAKALKADQVL